jgi:predicted regulator of Ras-like GTPase activity (Roadblock/LC7/MglB family)
MGLTVFAQILESMVKEIPGAKGAVFVDWEGEAVDEYCHGSATEIRLGGAHSGILYYQCVAAFEKLGLDPPTEVVLRFERESILISRVTKEYLVIIVLERETPAARARWLVQRAARRLQEEM